ncbi:MAG: hypothetical protein PHC86_01640, partial [Eubacteriales bacterium]|nr:hypothetical protein [Eubacteriales bacterium]
MIKKDENPAVEPHTPIHPGEMTPHHQDQTSGPTITMQGVSGKKITGTVKVVKVVKAGAQNESAHEVAESAPDVHAPAPA